VGFISGAVLSAMSILLLKVKFEHVQAGDADVVVWFF
jgi:hypothetical protein